MGHLQVIKLINLQCVENGRCHNSVHKQSSLGLSDTTQGLAHETLVLITLSSSEGSGKSVHMHRLA